MLNFQRVAIADKQRIEAIYHKERGRGCEYTFGNVFVWRDVYQTSIAYTDDGMLVVRFDTDNLYLFPAGNGDLKKTVLDIENDCAARGTPLTFIAASKEDVQKLDTLFPGIYRWHENRDFAEYVYNSEDLIRLAGKKYHGKRNHISRFVADYPDYVFEEITPGNIEQARAMNDKWYDKYLDDADAGLAREKNAANNAFDYFFDLGYMGGLIRVDGKVAAFAMGEPIDPDTFCVHIEKACYDIKGAYTVINRDFAQYFCNRYRYINREDDAGQEGLRKAKLSYHPALITEKYVVTKHD